MSYNLYLDDMRDVPNRHFVLVRSSVEALDYVRINGLPACMSLDHDLGGDDTGLKFVKALQQRHPHGPVPEYHVHSANPVGKANIEGFLESWRRFCCSPMRERALPFGVLFEQHHELCACSYCDDKHKPTTLGFKTGFGVSWPISKSHTSWRVIYYRPKIGTRFYLRWTIPLWINKIINRGYYRNA